MKLSDIKWTPKQKELFRLLRNPDIDYLLVDGGARSGKTTGIVHFLFRVAMLNYGVRIFAGRQRLAHARDSLWRETIADVISSYTDEYGTGWHDKNETLLLIEFGTESQLWVGGFDDKERIEKILGRGFSIIYLNEASQIDYAAYRIATTRLSQVVPGVKQMVVIDCNPPSPSHWLHRLFYDHVEPKDGKPLVNPERYAVLKINPMDNVENLPPGFIDKLDQLPERDRDRFKYGRYTKPEGAIFEALTEDLLIDDRPDCDFYSVGVDLITYSAVLVGFSGQTVYFLDEYGGIGFTASELNEAIYAKWIGYQYFAWLDHNLGEAGIREFFNSALALKGPGSVEGGLNIWNQLLKTGRCKIHRDCVGLYSQMENYHRDDLGRIVKEDDHYIDAGRMAIYSEIMDGRVSIEWVEV